MFNKPGKIIKSQYIYKTCVLLSQETKKKKEKEKGVLACAIVDVQSNHDPWSMIHDPCFYSFIYIYIYILCFL